MRTFNIEISEEQLRLIRAAIINVTNQEINNPGLLTEEENEEMEMIADMILDVCEGDDEDITHGFCY